MIKVRVEIPFRLKDAKKDYVPNDIIEVTEETLDRIRAVNINMVSVIAKGGESAASAPAPAPKKKSNTGAKKKSSAK